MSSADFFIDVLPVELRHSRIPLISTPCGEPHPVWHSEETDRPAGAAVGNKRSVRVSDPVLPLRSDGGRGVSADSGSPFDPPPCPALSIF